jgi:hypothetical protein
MSTAAVFLDIEKAFDTTWHPALLYKLSKLQFSSRLMTTPRYMQAGVPQGSVISPTLYNLYINDTPQTSGVNLALFADDTCLYAIDRKEGYVLRKIQRGLNCMAAWRERWNIKNIKINEDKTHSSK